MPWYTCALDGCEVQFEPRPGRSFERCCSERHGKNLWKQRELAAGRNPRGPRTEAARRNSRKWTQRRRALAYDPDAEPINVTLVFERDNWVCGLCKERVWSWLSYPDPDSASLDHVVPLARGGKHRYDNVQLAHWRCNIGKGADTELEPVLLS